MKVGALSHVVTVRAPVGVLSETDAVDVATSVPAAIAVLPAQFQQRETLATGGLRTQTLYGVTLRYRTDILASYVLVEECCTERTFQILAVVPGDKRDVVEMTCVTNG
jgi:hypothetical protein